MKHPVLYGVGWFRITLIIRLSPAFLELGLWPNLAKWLEKSHQNMHWRKSQLNQLPYYGNKKKEKTSFSIVLRSVCSYFYSLQTFCYILLIWKLYTILKEEVICQINPANSVLFAGIILQIVSYFPDYENLRSCM